jgi:hypothetical protein
MADNQHEQDEQGNEHKAGLQALYKAMSGKDEPPAPPMPDGITAAAFRDFEQLASLDESRRYALKDLAEKLGFDDEAAAMEKSAKEAVDAYIAVHPIPMPPRRRWWNHRHFSLLPEFHYRARDEWNSAAVALRWLIFHIHLNDYLEFDLHISLSANGLMAYISLPYIRLRLDIPFPFSVWQFAQRWLTRKGTAQDND